MATQAASVAEAAYKVGYESASQFSREYSRAFGVAPKQDALKQQQLQDLYASRTVRSAECISGAADIGRVSSTTCAL